MGCGSSAPVETSPTTTTAPEVKPQVTGAAPAEEQTPTPAPDAKPPAVEPQQAPAEATPQPQEPQETPAQQETQQETPAQPETPAEETTETKEQPQETPAPPVETTETTETTETKEAPTATMDAQLKNNIVEGYTDHTAVDVDDLKWMTEDYLNIKAAENPVAHLASLNVFGGEVRAKKTGIICTIGPASNNPDTLVELRKNGMNCMRMNLSHGDYEEHASKIENLKKSFEMFPGDPVALALDTKGPEIRTGRTRDGAKITLTKDETVMVSTDDARAGDGDKDTIYVDYKNIVNVMEVGGHVYLDDGLIDLEVLEIEGDALKCKICNSGLLGSKKGCNLPGSEVDLPILSEKDTADLRWAVEMNCDMVFASFVRNADDIHAIRKVLGDDGKHIQIISKIENQQGLNNFMEILKVTDGIMVARGDLGIEIPAHKVFLAQKMMIAKSNIAGKPVICATQMLETMQDNPRPTRAEVTDVANAVLDGADCVMLSGESATGQYPGRAVQTMADICREAEATMEFAHFYRSLQALRPRTVDVRSSEAVCSSAVSIASEMKSVRAIVVLSLSGRTARLVAKYRPRVAIVCITPNETVCRQLLITRGVVPFLISDDFDDTKETFQVYQERQMKECFSVLSARENPLVKAGDAAVVVCGWQVGRNQTNTMRILTV